eukprot:s6625_g7.t1
MGAHSPESQTTAANGSTQPGTTEPHHRVGQDAAANWRDVATNAGPCRATSWKNDSQEWKLQGWAGSHPATNGKAATATKKGSRKPAEFLAMVVVKEIGDGTERAEPGPIFFFRIGCQNWLYPIRGCSRPFAAEEEHPRSFRNRLEAIHILYYEFYTLRKFVHQSPGKVSLLIWGYHIIVLEIMDWVSRQ